MRKSLVAALAAIFTLSAAGVALAQFAAPAPTLTVTTKPQKSGTKSHPRSTNLTLKVVNNYQQSKTTLSQIVIFFPKTVTLNGKGFKKCDPVKLAGNGASACPKASKAGKGSAHAVLGPYDVQAPLSFTVTAYVGGPKLMLFYLQQKGGVTAVLKGKMSKASGKFGSKMTIHVPDGTQHVGGPGSPIEPNLQQPVPGTYSALKDFKTSIGLVKGKHILVSTTGCTGGKRTFQATLSYVPNPTPPATTKASDTATAACTK